MKMDRRQFASGLAAAFAALNLPGAPSGPPHSQPAAVGLPSCPPERPSSLPEPEPAHSSTPEKEVIEMPPGELLSACLTHETVDVTSFGDEYVTRAPSGIITATLEFAGLYAPRELQRAIASADEAVFNCKAAGYGGNRDWRVRLHGFVMSFQSRSSVRGQVVTTVEVRVEDYEWA